MNHLQNQTSPYLLQHADNPVNWYPWCPQAFQKARDEDKPIFLSIGYSTCHWCHVMAHESFENPEIAEILNKHFVAIKVDKEERPDVDAIYMAVCQALTGSGGWPMSIFMTPDQKPFFAGTYFPPQTSYGMLGFKTLLNTISEKWHACREELLHSADELLSHLEKAEKPTGDINPKLVDYAFLLSEHNFDSLYGGFGGAPKFPTPHHLLFLLEYARLFHSESARNMAETTLTQMYKGGIFDHIGGGFCRYSTDKYFLVPHFEKMLYDNALLLMAYAQAYQLTQNPLYQKVVEETARYILREMASPDGGFYCAQDADSEHVEGRYYVFDYDEILNVLGEEEGKRFAAHYGITHKGNFEGKNIPNLLHNPPQQASFHKSLKALYQYRRQRTKLHLDDKILTFWNALMIAAFAMLSRVFSNREYLEVAKRANHLIERKLLQNDTLYVGIRGNVRTGKGFLDDYAGYAFALIKLYEATFDESYMQKAQSIVAKAVENFYDRQHGGFYLYGKDNEQLILMPKETYDGALPSGNSMMAFNLIKLAHFYKSEQWESVARQQFSFLGTQAEENPMGHTFFLLSLLCFLHPKEIVCVPKEAADIARIVDALPMGWNITASILPAPTQEYRLHNDLATFYICEGRRCLPPTNDKADLAR